MDVILYQNHPADLDIDRESTHVKHCIYLLLDLHKHIIGILLDGLLRVLLTDGVCELQLVQTQLLPQVIPTSLEVALHCARIAFLSL
jgi:hypothetical protein